MWGRRFSRYGLEKLGPKGTLRTICGSSPPNYSATVKIEYPNLDFLRSIAVLLVVACHVGCFYTDRADLLVPIGALGVDLFFVHTALVLMQSLERQDQNSSKHLFRSFITRRFFRIYPLATLVTAAVLCFHIPQGSIKIGHIAPIYPNAGVILYNLTLTQGFFVLVPSIIGPLWSLSCEVEMYLLLPFLYRLLRGRQYSAPILYVGVLTISTMVVYWYPYEACYSFLRLLRVAPSFMPGLVAYWLSKKVGPRFPAYSWCLLVLALPPLVVSGWFPMSGWNPGWFWWVPGWFWWIPMIVGFAIPWFKQITFPALTAGSRVIARYSYGVYLVHYFCIWAGLEKLGHGHPVLGPLLFCVLVTAIPVALYHAVEKPFITVGKICTATRTPRFASALVPANRSISGTSYSA
jgi:peptidoglycan/LPS O-acetylase OafA/YrhL